MTRAPVPCEAGVPPCGVLPTRRYLNADLCVEHAPSNPSPPPGTTLAERLAAAGVRMTTPAGPTVVDQRAIASGKRRASATAYRNATRNVPVDHRPDLV